MNKETIISSGLLELYVLGETNSEETELVIMLCNKYSDVKLELENIELALEQYAMGHGVVYPKGTKANLFTKLNLTDDTDKIAIQSAPIAPMRNYRNLAAACAILLLASTVMNVLFFSQAKKADDKIATLAQKMTVIEKEEAEEKESLNVVRSKYSLPLKMNACDIAPKDADAKIYWLTNTGEIFIDAANLPNPPNGMQYQLWAIVNGKAVDAGLVMYKNGKSLRLQQMKTFGKAEAFALTLEVEGGVAASKEKPYLITRL